MQRQCCTSGHGNSVDAQVACCVCVPVYAVYEVCGYIRMLGASAMTACMQAKHLYAHLPAVYVCFASLCTQHLARVPEGLHIYMCCPPGYLSSHYSFRHVDIRPFRVSQANLKASLKPQGANSRTPKKGTRGAASSQERLITGSDALPYVQRVGAGLLHASEGLQGDSACARVYDIGQNVRCHCGHRELCVVLCVVLCSVLCVPSLHRVHADDVLEQRHADAYLLASPAGPGMLPRDPPIHQGEVHGCVIVTCYCDLLVVTQV